MVLGEVVSAMRGRQDVGHAGLGHIPKTSGLYTAWLQDEERCLYVGKASNLLNRIRSHYSGQRGSDQFCLYVYDKYVFPARRGELSTSDVNQLTSKWIRGSVTFRYVEVPERELAALEIELRRHWQPILNPHQ